MKRQPFEPWWMGDAWSGMARLRQDLDRIFHDAPAAWPGQSYGAPFPPVNLYESGEGFILTAEIPGVRREDVEVSVEGDRVALRGERRTDVPKDERTSLHRRERQTGSFRRSVQLPVPVDPEKAEAVYRAGILTLRLPKVQAHQPRRIAVVAE